MAYQTYTTRALVLNTYERSGSDKTIQLFTEEAGMLYARAVGVRDEKSKMRYALQPFSLVLVTLVRGKVEWRIIGVESMRNIFFDAKSRMARAQVSDCVKLVERFVKGEERHARLYGLLEEGVRHISNDPSSDALLALRLRLLHELGYISLGESCRAVCFAETLEEALAKLVESGSRSEAERSITAALTASHL